MCSVAHLHESTFVWKFKSYCFVKIWTYRFYCKVPRFSPKIIANVSSLPAQLIYFKLKLDTVFYVSITSFTDALAGGLKWKNPYRPQLYPLRR